MDDLLVKHLLGETSAREQQQVAEWLAESPDHALYFAQLQQVWESSRQLASESAVNEDQAWQRFRQRIQPVEEKKPVIHLQWLRVAATLTLLIALGWAISQWIGGGEKVQEMAVSTVRNVLVDSLPDGTTVTLNKNSSLHYPSRFTGKQRPVRLQGEAFFNVKPDKEKPFIITVNDVEVTVLGTSFNIRTDEKGRTEVVVETGRVRVSHAGRTIELQANERTLIATADSTLQKESQPDKLYNYYRTREFVCNDTPLWKLAEVLNEAYGVEITLTTDYARSQRINTTFNNESLERVLDLISETCGVQISRTGNQIEIR
ncbi:MAG: DUF4974 domain-containing protein [Chitinophagaceae bacterium]|jgi:ferric-dicitrate binding protein FerR (iron transport regulator)|nr:DUF4974 domain-containing protein [Chitinophagaceae bacterium]